MFSVQTFPFSYLLVPYSSLLLLLLVPRPVAAPRFNHNGECEHRCCCCVSGQGRHLRRDVVAPDSKASEPRLLVPAQTVLDQLDLLVNITLSLEDKMVTHFKDMPPRSTDHERSQDPAAYTQGL